MKPGADKWSPPCCQRPDRASLCAILMSIAKPLRKMFVEPTVSEPIDALDATRAFGGMLGQVVIGGGSSGTALDDGDFGVNSYYDSPGQDGVDSGPGPV